LPRLLKFGGEILSTFLNEKFLSTPWLSTIKYKKI
jgi:hypothetical protein